MKNHVSLAFLMATVPVFLALSACSKDSEETTDGTGGQSTTSGGSGTATGGNGGQAQGGASGGSSSTGTTTAASDDLLIDDFEDGDEKSLVPGGWYSYTDESNGGGSKISFTGATGADIAMNGEGFESTKSLEATYSFDQGTLTYDPYIGIGVSIGTAAAPYDLSSYAGVSFSYKGGAHTVRVETSDVTDYDQFGVVLSASSSWKTVTFPFKNFKQEGWGKAVTFDPSHVTALSFHVRGATGATATLQIDNLKIVKSLGELPPDMKINAAAPPADAVLDSLAITNPLQVRAETYLTKGYNVTNWLEQERFSSFKYDEAFVEKLSKAGFKSLRLPVDFDLYVETKTGTGDSLALTLHPDLFTILDAFDTWTKKYGMSLTIDYHQYGTLLDKSDADSIGTAVQLWSKVAEHFASSPREDLFFELLNEPELSFGGTDPTQAEWTQIAEKMIAAIRAKDTTHSIIFGDIEWYAIGQLTKRTAPLSDTNVIYAFHDYDPFIFTHQGASWTPMGSTHDLPYPYDASRWSEYYSDLGFNTAMDSWILTAVQNYYRQGNKATLRNTIVNAKKWAVTHNVPVICNEFGALDLTSKLEDRARYYTDLIDIFEELKIPWQHWFMVMSDTGTVIPEYREAMGLGQ